MLDDKHLFKCIRNWNKSQWIYEIKCYKILPAEQSPARKANFDPAGARNPQLDSGCLLTGPPHPVGVPNRFQCAFL